MLGDQILSILKLFSFKKGSFTVPKLFLQAFNFILKAELSAKLFAIEKLFSKNFLESPFCSFHNSTKNFHKIRDLQNSLLSKNI